MSHPNEPISPARFASALKDLSLPSLHLKVLELRNSLAHLDYSNEQLRPFAYSPDSPDQDCLDAIRENEQVIERMQERIRLVRVEVEGRGFSWTEFQSKEELEALDNAELGVVTNGEHQQRHQQNGESGEEEEEEQRHSAWTDGTFQTGRISGGEIRMDPLPSQQQQQQNLQRGGSIGDEELRRRMEERLRDLGVGEDHDDEGGLHL